MVRSKKTNKRKKVQRGGILTHLFSNDDEKEKLLTYLMLKLVNSKVDTFDYTSKKFYIDPKKASDFVTFLQDADIEFPYHWIYSDNIPKSIKEETDYFLENEYYSFFKLYEIWLRSYPLKPHSKELYGVLKDMKIAVKVERDKEEAERDKKEAEEMKKQMINDLKKKYNLSADATWEAIAAKSEAEAAHIKAEQDKAEQRRQALDAWRAANPQNPPIHSRSLSFQGGKKSKKRSKRKKSKKSRKARKSRKSRRK